MDLNELNQYATRLEGRPARKIDFCWSCGSRVIKTEHVSHYDVDSGKAVTYEEYRCPNAGWFIEHTLYPTS